MTVPLHLSAIEQQNGGYRRLPVLSQRPVQTYFTGRFTKGEIPHNTLANDSKGSHLAELAITTYEWAHTISTKFERKDGKDAVHITADLPGRD